MADPLHDNPKSPRKKFDPEGDDYDYETAKGAGLKPQPVEDDDRPHWPSREPKTGMLLKGRKHKTWQMGVDEDAKLGYKLRKGDDGRYYTHKDEE
jgi:hypothetical protein